jgi:hypothetical protein
MSHRSLLTLPASIHLGRLKTALVAVSKVYYFLGKYDEAHFFALGAGTAMSVS